MSDLNQKILEIALAEYGVAEIEGAESNSRVVNYFKEVGFPNIQSDDVAWCAAFANWVLLKAGQPHSSKLTARSLLHIGEEVTEPQLGDIVVFWTNSPSSWRGHVGFYINEDQDDIYVLGGNQSNQVNISKYSKTRFLGYRRMKQLNDGETCHCEVEEINDTFLTNYNKNIPSIPVRLVYMDVRRNKAFEEKIEKTASQQLKLRFHIESSQKIREAYDVEWLYREHNLDTAVHLAETQGLNDKGITVFIGQSSSHLNGFALRWLNAVFVDDDSRSKYSSTIAHEFGHIFGLNHTFEMTDEEKDKLGIAGESETFNLMNYNVYTDHLTSQQINVLHHNAAEKFPTA